MSTEAYFLHLDQKNIDNLLFVNQLNSKKFLVKQRLNVLEYIVDILKLICKYNLSYNGKNNVDKKCKNKRTHIL